MITMINKFNTYYDFYVELIMSKDKSTRLLNDLISTVTNIRNHEYKIYTDISDPDNPNLEYANEFIKERISKHLYFIDFNNIESYQLINFLDDLISHNSNHDASISVYVYNVYSETTTTVERSYLSKKVRNICKKYNIFFTDIWDDFIEKIVKTPETTIRNLTTEENTKISETVKKNEYNDIPNPLISDSKPRSLTNTTNRIGDPVYTDINTKSLFKNE